MNKQVTTSSECENGNEQIKPKWVARFSISLDLSRCCQAKYPTSPIRTAVVDYKYIYSNLFATISRRVLRIIPDSLYKPIYNLSMRVVKCGELECFIEPERPLQQQTLAIYRHSLAQSQNLIGMRLKWISK